MNPDTTYGLAVTQGVIDQARLVQQNRDAATAKATATAQKTEERRVERRQQKSLAFEQVVFAVSVPRFNWDKVVGRGEEFKTDTVKLALQEWVGDHKYATSLKSTEIVTDFKRRFCSMRVAFLLCMMDRYLCE